MDKTSERTKNISATRLALLARQMRTTVEGIELLQSEPIAIIGMSCRFPDGANDPEAYWQLLQQGRDAIKEVPAGRWNAELSAMLDGDQQAKTTISQAGFLDQVDQFDAAFFGITPLEAVGMDPQQRVLLEVTWEALEHAGQIPTTLAGSRTGVFMAIYQLDYAHQTNDPTKIDAYGLAGNAHSVAANRLSYFLDLRGPSIAVDTGCSASLVTTHLACQSLRNGECRMAVAGGVNLILSPAPALGMVRLGMLAPDARCKTFDEKADGFVRGEGCGIFVLKRLSDALSDGDPIRALIRGTAVNQDGRTLGLTAPNGLSQQAVMRQALKNACVSPEQVYYIETHGTGTSLGDPIEVEALTEVYGQQRSADNPCFLGAVKSNIGHTEAASGIAGLIKTVLVLQHEEIPPNLHWQKLNPHIFLGEAPFIFPTHSSPWPKEKGKRRFAAVSSFGMGGTNAHIILEEALDLPVTACTENTADNRAYLLPISAHTTQALQAQVQVYSTWLETHTQTSLHDICAIASLRRHHHNHRLALIGNSHQDLIEQAQDYISGERKAGFTFAGHKRKTIFVCPGQGSQWAGMGQELFAQEPVFRETILRCEAALHPYVSWSLSEQIQQGLPWNNLAVIQPTLFAFSVSLAALWRSWGVFPDAVIGHSMGEVAAACIAGILSLDEAARLICLRSQILHQISGMGGMLQVELTEHEASQEIAGLEHSISIAVCNSPRATVLAGEIQTLELLKHRLEERAVFSRWIKVDVASHSPQVDQLQAELETRLAGIRGDEGNIAFYSTMRARLMHGNELDTSYWIENLRRPVQFATMIAQVWREGYETFIELSPHPILTYAMQETLESEPKETAEVPSVVIGSLRHQEPERATMLRGLGQLYSHGCGITWSALIPALYHWVDLPSYPFQRQRFWLDPTTDNAVQSGTPKQQGNLAGHHPLLQQHTISSLQPRIDYWDSTLSLTSLPYLTQHRVQGIPIMPGAAYLEAVLTATRELYPTDRFQITQLDLKQLLAFSEQPEATRHLQLVFRSSGDSKTPITEQQPLQFFLNSQSQNASTPNQWITHASGEILLNASQPAIAIVDIAAIQARCPQKVTATEHYALLAKRGVEYGPSFRGVVQAWQGESEALGQIQLPAPFISEAANMTIHPALLDACLQIINVAASSKTLYDDEALYLPVGFAQVHLLKPLEQGKPLWSHVSFLSLFEDRVSETGSAPDHNITQHQIQIILYQKSGEPVMVIQNLQVQNLAPETTLEQAIQQENREQWLYTQHWLPYTQPATSQGEEPGQWLILAESTTTGVGKRLQDQLEQRGAHCIIVQPGPTFAQNAENCYTINPHNLADFQMLANKLFASEKPSCRAIVHLWGFDKVSSHALTEREHLSDIQQSAYDSVLYLVQAMAIIPWTQSPRLWLVTQGTQRLDQDTSEIEEQALAHNALWGLGRTIAHEIPELFCSCIDIGQGTDTEITALLSVCLSQTTENQLAIRNEAIYVARLQKHTPSLLDKIAVVQEQASYLITGGLGALGRLVARWLVMSGARYLILVSRRTMKEDDRAFIEQLSTQGVQILPLALDIAQEDQVTHLLATIEKVGWPALRGIIHAAALLDDGIVLQQTPERFTKVRAPKADGAWLLHQQTRTYHLDWFVLFSGGASLLGSAGQGPYASANAFVDGLAHYRRSRGLPALSINWGPWAEIGLAAAQANRGARMAHYGIGSIPPEQGIILLEQLISASMSGTPYAQIAVLPLNLSYWRQQTFDLPILRDLLQMFPSRTQPGEKMLQAGVEGLPQKLQIASSRERVKLIEDFLHKQGAAVLHIPLTQLNLQQPLSELGIDSLMALELKKRIELALAIQISPVKLLQGPSLKQIAAWILDELADIPGFTTKDKRFNHPCLVPIQIHGKNRPFFCVHGAMGYALAYTDLAKHLGQEQPFYGLQAPGLQEEEQPLQDVRTMAEHYISAIRTVQPFGPYFLGGASFGGVIAFEMAQQLQAQGEKVALLALIDSIKPAEVIDVPIDDMRALIECARFMGYFFKVDVTLSREELLPLTDEERLTRIVEIYQQTREQSLSLGYAEVKRQFLVFNAIMQANKSYRPGINPCRLTFFRAMEGLPEALLPPEFPQGDLAEGWRTLTLKPMKVYDIPGDHVTMAREPHVQVLAEKLAACMQEAEGTISHKGDGGSSTHVYTN